MVAPPLGKTTAMRHHCCRYRPRMLPLLLFLSVAVLVSPRHRGVASAYQYKVGDLDAWGVPPPGKPQLYDTWSKTHHFQIGDSLLFLYPPSKDSVVQVTETAFNTCSVGEPILKLDDGNSVFNITVPGVFYFTSGVPGHCQKHQRLRVAVPSGNGTFFPPDAAGGALSATAPAYPTVFGPTPAPSAAPPRPGVALAAGLGLLGLILLSLCA